MTWQIDPAHTQIQFSVRHMMIANVRGRFERFEGIVDFDEDNPANTTIDFRIETGSIYTHNADRDAHLRSADFFDAENYPHMTFKSRRVELMDDNHARLIGDLTIRDVTREIRLEVDYAGQAEERPGIFSAGFSLNASINRKAWGLEWNQALASGGYLIGDNITITVEAELIKRVKKTAVEQPPT